MRDEHQRRRTTPTASGGDSGTEAARTSPWSVVLLVLAVAFGGVAGLPLLVTAQEQPPQVNVGEVQVTPSDPAVGEPVVLTATVRNSERSESGFEISRVEIRDIGGVNDRVLVGQEDAGTLGPGDSTTLSLTTRFDTPGVKQLVFAVYGGSTTGFGGATISYPVTVVVESTEPRIDTSYGDLLVQTENEFTVTVSNGKQSPVRDVRVTVGGEGFSVKEPSKSVAFVEGGGSVPFSFVLTSESPGPREVEVDLAYTISGVEYSERETQTVVFKRLGEKVATVSRFTQRPPRVTPGGSFDLSFDATNRGETALRDLTFAVDLTGTSLRAGPTGTDVYVEELPARATRAITYQLRASEEAPSGIVTVPLSYNFTTENGERVVERTTLSVEVLGQPELRTFVRVVEPTDAGYRVTVDVANVGDGLARSAAIRLGEASYFLGDIGPGEFETATLSVSDTGEHVAAMTYKNAFNEPLEREETVVLPARSTGPAVPLWLTGAFVTVVIVAGVWWWRR